MKKGLAIVLAVLLLFGATACGGEKEMEEQESSMEETSPEPEEDKDIPPDEVDEPEEQEDPEVEPSQPGSQNPVTSGGTQPAADPYSGTANHEAQTSGVEENTAAQADARAEQTMYVDPAIYPVGTDRISAVITNQSAATEGGYGLAYRIERKRDDGNWETLPLPIEVMEIAAVLMPGEANTEVFSLYTGDYGYTPGTYRIVMTDVTPNLVGEFILE